MSEKSSNDAYWLALGRFIATFTHVEQAFHSYLWLTTGVDPRLLRAILPDARIGNVSSALNKIWQSRSDEPPALYTRAIQQVGLLQRLRNDICHSPSKLTDKGLLISNLTKALPGKEMEAIVTVETLERATYDLHIARACILALISEDICQSPDATPLPWASLAQTPWRYKQPTQSTQDRKSREQTQAQHSPPRSSPR